MLIRGSSIVAQTIWAERAPTIGSRVAGWAASSARIGAVPDEPELSESEPPHPVRPALATVSAAANARKRRERRDFMIIMGVLHCDGPVMSPREAAVTFATKYRPAGIKSTGQPGISFVTFA